MSDRVRWIEHKGAEILYVDYSGTSEEEYVETIEAFKNELLKCPPGSVVTLTNVADSTITEKVTEKFKELQEQTKGISKAGAAIGVTGFKRALAQLIKRDLHFARSMEEAKDWLAEQANK
jgi:hypothetical protein